MIQKSKKDAIEVLNKNSTKEGITFGFFIPFDVADCEDIKRIRELIKDYYYFEIAVSNRTMKSIIKRTPKIKILEKFKKADNPNID